MKRVGYRILVLLSVEIAVMSVNAGAASLNRRKVTMVKGTVLQLKVRGAGKKKVTWKSSKKKVASVSKKGKVRAVRAGTAKITAKDGKKKLTCRITVKNHNKKVKQVRQVTPVTASRSSASQALTTKLDSNTGSMGSEDAAAYLTMLSLRRSYPDGMVWTDDFYYQWRGGVFRGGLGCSAFAMMISDYLFGSKPARLVRSFSQLRPGDIVRYRETVDHMVIVMKVVGNMVVVGEGNLEGKVHWGRTIPLHTLISSGYYMLTRW